MDAPESMGLDAHKSPTGLQISWSVRTLSNVIFRGLGTLHHLPQHAVKITKYFAHVARERFLETLYLKIMLEKSCPEGQCQSTREVNFNDRVQLIALMEFAVFGINQAVQDKTLSLEASFNKFYKENILFIMDRTESFSTHI